MPRRSRPPTSPPPFGEPAGSGPKPPGVPVRLTVYLSRAQVRAGWRSRVDLLRAIRVTLAELPGDDGGTYPARVVFEEERTPGVVSRPEPPDAEVYADPVERVLAAGYVGDKPRDREDEELMDALAARDDRLDAGLAEAEYQAALANLNAVRAEAHLTGWSTHRLRRHLEVDHHLSPTEVSGGGGTLVELHRKAHELPTFAADAREAARTRAELGGERRHPPTFAPPSEESPSNVTHLSTGIEGGFCGSVEPHGPHDDCDGA